jgi:hypothetical protein
MIAPSKALMGFPAGPDVLLGVVEDGGAGPTVVSDWREKGGTFPLAFLTGPQRRTLIAVDIGRPLEFSLGRTYQADARVDRSWSPMRSWNGAYTATLPADALPAEAAVRPVGMTGFSENIGVDTRKTAAEKEGGLARTLPWANVILHFGSTAGWPAEPQQPSYPLEAQLSRRYADPAIPSAMTGSGWEGYGTAADGTRFVLVDRAYGYAEPARVYAMLLWPGSEQVVDGGPVDPKAVLPIAVKLPGGRGVAIAQYQATLRWRTGTGPWSAPATSAALAPAGTTQVEVTRKGGTPEVVTLPR